jgi:hypothetical protein
MRLDRLAQEARDVLALHLQVVAGRHRREAPAARTASDPHRFRGDAPVVGVRGDLQDRAATGPGPGGRGP